jgi:hypothetical protein
VRRESCSSTYDLVIGLDRSDTKADLCLIDIRTGQRRAEIIATAPKALWEWLLELTVVIIYPCDPWLQFGLRLICGCRKRMMLL